MLFDNCLLVSLCVLLGSVWLSSSVAGRHTSCFGDPVPGKIVSAHLAQKSSHNQAVGGFMFHVVCKILKKPFFHMSARTLVTPAPHTPTDAQLRKLHTRTRYYTHVSCQRAEATLNGQQHAGANVPTDVLFMPSTGRPHSRFK